MRGNTAGFGSPEVLVRALLDEFPELDPGRVRLAVERATARVANAAMDTAAHQFVDGQLAQVEATEEAAERARILRELSDNLEDRKDADRALVVRLAAFHEAAGVADLDPLLRLGRLTGRWIDLPLDEMTRMITLDDDASPRRLGELAAAWRELGFGYRAADCLERLLALVPADTAAHEALELFYRSQGEWGVLIDLLGRRTVHVDDAERAELFRELGQIYDRELSDDEGALDAYREADRMEPDHPDVLDALARLEQRGGSDGEALITLDRLARLVREPARRAQVVLRAADIARLHDYDKAQRLYEQARGDDPDLVGAVDGLAGLLRDRGDLAGTIALLVDAAARPGLAAERSRWLADAADFSVATGDTDRAKQLYRAARAADPGNHKAGLALIELCWDTGDLADLAPMLDELCRTTSEPGRQRGYLMQRAKLARELGDAATEQAMLGRAVELDPHDPSTRRELADLAFDAGDWIGARQLIEGLLDDHEDLLQPEVSVELHYRVARCARELGDIEGAARHAAVTLALQPDHEPALRLRADLAITTPEDVLADQLALANLAPPDEKGPRFSALGDRYAELGDRATAREMYREALGHLPSDHLLLTKFLGLVADQGDWSYSLDLVYRLIDTERDPKVRARYRHLAAMIARDELGRPGDAAPLFQQAIDDDPRLFTAADELEALLAGDREALLRFYYLRLEHVRHDEGRSGERLRLWDKLGELCAASTDGHGDGGEDRRDDALTAFEVALSLDPHNVERRQRLADLYTGADPKHLLSAVAHHHAILAGNRRRVASYQALRGWYRRTVQPEKARAVSDALDALDQAQTQAQTQTQNADAAAAQTAVRRAARTTGAIQHRVSALFKPSVTDTASGARVPLGNDDWIALGSDGVDPQLSALFALVAPAFVAERARTRPLPPAADWPELRGLRDHAALAKVIDHVAQLFGVACPPVYADRHQLAACGIVLRPASAAGAVWTPVLVLGLPALDRQLDDAELAFVLARQLADLRSDRFARVLCPRPSDLAQLVELALAHDPAGGSAGSRWLATALGPVEHDQVLAIAARLRDRAVDPVRAARGWLAATDRAADRIGLVITGDLAACLRVLERETRNGGDAQRLTDLVWGSVTDDVLSVRARLERWPARTPVTT